MDDAIVNFLSYELEKLDFKRNTVEDSEISISISLLSQENETDHSLVKITLKLTITGVIESKLVLAGIFKKADDYPEDFKETNALHIIGASILLPYARSILSFISSVDGKKPILLPTVNLNNFFTKNEEMSE